jgi:poly(A) polymerase
VKYAESLEVSAARIVRNLKAQGHEACWAGGCVRDMLLGCQPADIDIATSARPEQIVSIFPRTRKVGVQFGVVLVRQNSHWFEVATFRQDIDYTDGRRPERVVFTSAEEDAKRRDFTINGLFYDPQTEQVIDYVGGRADLEAGIIRAIGNPAERFAEDHLRMLRAARFTARLNFHLDPATADAIREQAARLARISAERIREELDKMFAHPSRARAVTLLADLGLTPYLWPGADWPPERVQAGTAALAALPEPVDFVLGMAALLHDRSREEAEAIGRALRCSNREIDDLTWMVGEYEGLCDTRRLSLAQFKTLAAHPRFQSLLALHYAVCHMSGRTLEGYESAVRLLGEIPPEELAPPPLITGEDLIAAGRQPGPEFKRILDTLYTAQLNNELRTRDQALQRLRVLLAG